MAVQSLPFYAFVILAVLSSSALANTTTAPAATTNGTTAVTTAANTTASTAPAPTTTPVPPAPTCTSVTAAAGLGFSTLFVIAGDHIDAATCTQLNFTQTGTVPPTTTAATTTTPATTATNATTTEATTTAATTATNATTTVATTATNATTTAATTATNATTPMTTPVTTAAPSGLVQPLSVINSTTSATAIWSPPAVGLWTVTLLCGANTPVCSNQVFVNNAGSIQVALTGSAPTTDVSTFLATVTKALAAAAGLDAVQVPQAFIVPPTTRRRSADGFAVQATLVSTQTNDFAAAAHSIAQAATSGALNTQLQANNLPSATGVTFNGHTDPANPATTAATTTAVIGPTPAPSASSVLSMSVATIIAMLFAAVLAFF